MAVNRIAPAAAAAAGGGDSWTDIDMSATTVIDLASALDSVTADGDNYDIATNTTVHRIWSTCDTLGLVLTHTIPVTYADTIGVIMRLDIVSPDPTNNGNRGILIGLGDSTTACVANHGSLVGIRINSTGKWFLGHTKVDQNPSYSQVNPWTCSFMEVFVMLDGDIPAALEGRFSDGAGDIRQRRYSAWPTWTSPGTDMIMWCAFDSDTTRTRAWKLRWRYKLVSQVT